MRDRLGGGMELCKKERESKKGGGWGERLRYFGKRFMEKKFP